MAGSNDLASFATFLFSLVAATGIAICQNGCCLVSRGVSDMLVGVLDSITLFMSLQSENSENLPCKWQTEYEDCSAPAVVPNAWDSFGV